jgi:hypothetical protein
MTDKDKLKWIFVQALVLNNLIDTALRPLHFSLWKEGVNDPIIQNIFRELDKIGQSVQPNNMACINMLYNFLVLPWELLEKSSIFIDSEAWDEVNSLLAKAEVIKGDVPDVRRLRNALAHGHVDITDPLIFEDWMPGKEQNDSNANYIKFKLNPMETHEVIIKVLSAIVLPFLNS